MECRLVLMRHAKSSWHSDAADDHARPLNDRGRRDAPRVAERLRELDWLPDFVLSSDAVRTRETWQLMAEALAPDEASARIAVCWLPELYLGGIGALQHALEQHAGTARTVLALGHNPGWEQAASFLTGIGIDMSTAHACLLRASAPSWKVAVSSHAGWELVEHVRPRAL